VFFQVIVGEEMKKDNRLCGFLWRIFISCTLLMAFIKRLYCVITVCKEGLVCGWVGEERERKGNDAPILPLLFSSSGTAATHANN
jgi:hypothetical protein